MPTAFRTRPIDEDFTESDKKDIAKELKTTPERVSFTTHQVSTKESARGIPGAIVSHTLTGTAGPGAEYDPSRDPRAVAQEAARMTGEEIAKAIVAQRA